MRGQRIARAIAAIVVGLHIVVGITALVLLPRGFAWNDIHAWSNTVIPAALVGVAVVSFVQYIRGRSDGIAVLAAAAAGGWIVAVITGGVLFPISMPTSRLLVPAAAALALANVAWWSRASLGAMVPALLVGGALGHVVILAQRGPPPSTRPAGGTLAEVKGGSIAEEAATGQIQERCGKETIRLNPLLTFESRSPDATWTLLAPPDSFGPRRKLERWQKTATGFRAFYTDDVVPEERMPVVPKERIPVESSLVANRDKTGFEVEAISKLPRPVYAHLVTFTRIHFNFEAMLSFGPIGPELFPIEPADYPSGRPMQLAYLGEDLNLHVVRASDGEKGPYTELAKGPMPRDAALTIDISTGDTKSLPTGDVRAQHTQRKSGCRIVFKDWASQVSTESSPTAGWGLTQNSIQFFHKNGEAFVVMTLAETGPGRGWDSVAHAEGTYRNRLHTEDLR
jgi:hypothetical protein